MHLRESSIGRVEQLVASVSQPSPRGHRRTNISPGCFCRGVAWSLPHPRRERGTARGDCECIVHHSAFSPSQSIRQDLDQEDEVPLRQVEWTVLEPYHKQEVANKKQREDFKSQFLYEEKGFCKEGGEGDGY